MSSAKKKSTGSTLGTEMADAIIIGGGIAGLYAGVCLSQAGLRVVVLESTRRLGGRAQSWTDSTTGDPVHIGPHIFLTEYPNMFRLLDTLGTRDKLIWQDDHFITMVRGHERIVMKASRLPAPMQFMPSLLADETLPKLDLFSNIPVTLFAMQLDEDDVMRLDSMNAYAFLRLLGVSKNYIERFWAFTAMAIMNVPLEVCSAGALLRFYHRLIGHNLYYFGFPDGGLGDVFAPQAQAFIERHGGQVIFDAEVRELIENDGEVQGVSLVDGRRIEGRATIAALPPNALRRLLPRPWLERYGCFADLVHFQGSPYVSTFLWFDKKITNMKMWARFHSPNDLNCDFYDLSNIHSGWQSRNSVVASNIIYCDRASCMSDDEIIDATVAEIAESFAGASRKNVVHAVVNRIPMAVHCPFPGTERRRPPVQSPLRRLFLAGDWIQTGLPASMESAAMAAALAAEHVCKELGYDRRFAVPHDRIEGLTGIFHRAARLLPHKRWLRRSDAQRVVFG